MAVKSLFVTRVWDGALGDADLLAALLESCHTLARDDGAGRRWCREQGYGGYTSYASLDDLPVRDPAFGDLKRMLDRQVSAYAAASFMALGKRLKLDSLWVNVLSSGAGHSGHVHPRSVISGTLYVDLPSGASGLRLEDPRLPIMMAAPSRTDDAPEDSRSFVYLQPEAGTIYLWESWLRHEVPMWTGKGKRVSISFNYS